MNDSNPGRHTVIAAATRYWAGEAEIVRTYFGRPRTLAQDVFWLRAQAYKETQPFRTLPLDLQQEYLQTDTLVHHPDGPEAYVKFLQEMHHFRLLAEFVAAVSGESLFLTSRLELPEDHRLQEMRADYRRQGDIEKAAVGFTEGGGGAAFEVLSQLSGGEFEQGIAKIFTAIMADERSHGPMEIYTVARYAKCERDWQRAAAIVQEISRQRVIMRNEMFSYPLPPARIQEIDDGKIVPWPMNIAL